MDSPSRMEDAVYTNNLVQLRGNQTAVAAKAAALRERIKKLGADAEGSPEYVDLTNQLAQCTMEAEQLRKATLSTIRARIMNESAKKGNLNK